MRDLTVDERRAFLDTGTRTGHLATVRDDGRPHVAPIWFVRDGDDLVFTTWHASVKGRNLRRDGRASMSVDDPTPPFAFVHVTGSVAIDEDPSELRRWATRIAARYVGEDLADSFGRRNAVEGELLCRLRPDHWVATADLAD